MPRKEILDDHDAPATHPLRKEIDVDYLRRLAKIGCTRKEIAAVLDMEESTLYLHERRNPQITEIIEKGLEQGRADLRRWQHKAARRGQNAMLIWLGKQELGQTERVDPRTLAASTRDIDLSKLTDEEFEQYQVLIEKAKSNVATQNVVATYQHEVGQVELLSPTTPKADDNE